MSKKRPNKQVTEKRKAKMAKKSYYASDAAKRKWEEKKARKRNNSNVTDDVSSDKEVTEGITTEEVLEISESSEVTKTLEEET